MAHAREMQARRRADIVTFDATASGTLFYATRLTLRAGRRHAHGARQRVPCRADATPNASGEDPPERRFQGRRSDPRHAGVRSAEGAAVRRRDRSDSGRFEPVESWFATTAADSRSGSEEQDGSERAEMGQTSGERGGVRSRRAPRRSRAALRDPPREGHHEFSYIVARDDRRHVQRRAGAAEEMYEPEVFGRTVDADHRGEAVSARQHRTAAVAAALVPRRRRVVRRGPAPGRTSRSAATRSRRPLSTGNGELLYEARSATDGSRAHRLDVRRPAAAALVDATIAAEDRRFFVHPGVDPIAVARARRAKCAPPQAASKADRRSRSRSPNC